MKTTLSIKQARKLALISQGLHKKHPFGNGKSGVLRTIQHLGYVQIDTISVVERAHHHTLWSRCPDYTVQILHNLQVKDRKIFEYWSHAAAYLPMEDYRFCLPRMHAIARGERHWYAPDKRMMRQVLARVKQDGPLMAKDFEPPKGHKPGPWWNWKPAKRALEQLFIEGKLMVVRRNNFHKVYDLPERVLPHGIDTTVPTRQEFIHFLILRAIRAHGLVAEAEISYLRKGIKRDVKTGLKDLLKQGQVLPVRVAGLDRDFYTTENKLEQLSASRVAKMLHLLSPFDNAVIQRKRIEQLFAFDYQLECFVPAAKRVYGYFCLPILWAGQFIGRLDAKADRKAETLIVHKLSFEPGFKDAEPVIAPLANKLNAFARFNNCKSINLQSVTPKTLRSRLSKSIRELV